MSFFNRHFFAGCGTGVVLTVGVLILAAVILVQSATKEMGALIEEGSRFPPPDFPPAGRTSVYRDADLDWAVRTLQGDTISVASLQGRPILINFWATWCPPCVMEMPGLDSLRTALGDSVAILLVTEELEEVVTRSLDSNDWIRSTHLLVGELPAMYRSEAIPTTFIIDRQGRVVFRHVGAADWNSPEVKTFIEGL